MRSISVKKTAETRDDLIYIRSDETYRIFQVKEVLPGKRYRCLEFNIEPKKFNTARELNFGLVGVFHDRGKLTMEKTIKLQEVAGKVFTYKGLLMTIPMNVLLEI